MQLDLQAGCWPRPSRNWFVATKTFSCWSFTVKPSSWPICSKSACIMRMSQWRGTSTWPISTNSSPRAVAVEIDDVDVLAGQVLAEAADDARLVLAEGA